MTNGDVVNAHVDRVCSSTLRTVNGNQFEATSGGRGKFRQKKKSNKGKRKRGLQGVPTSPRRLKKMNFLTRNVTRNAIEAKKIKIVSTRVKKKQK